MEMPGKPQNFMHFTTELPSNILQDIFYEAFLDSHPAWFLDHLLINYTATVWEIKREGVPSYGAGYQFTNTEKPVQYVLKKQAEIYSLTQQKDLFKKKLVA